MLTIAIIVAILTTIVYISFKLTWFILKSIFSLIGDILEPLLRGTNWLWILIILAFLV